MKATRHHSVAGKQSLFRPCLLMLLVLFCSLPGWGSKQESIKKKEFNKSFNVDKSDILQVDNRYGNITVTHWSKSEVSIRVVIEAKARNDERAQAIIDRVNIRMEKMGNTVSAVTSLKSQNGNGGSNESFTINYYVSMPSELTCDLTQKYGNISMPENNKGKCDLHVKYGNLNGGNFTGPLNIEVQYGNMDISDVDNATLGLAYCGKSSVRNASQLNIDSKYSNLNLGKIQKMNVEAKYGDIHIDGLNSGYMELKYGNCKIDELKQGINVDELSYSTLTIKDLASNFDKVNVDARYGNLNIYIDVNASFRVVANNMKYGNCKIQGEFNIQRRNQDDNSVGFDSRDDQKNKNNYTLDVNNGKNGRINFEGNSYSNIKVIAK